MKLLSAQKNYIPIKTYKNNKDDIIVSTETNLFDVLSDGNKDRFLNNCK